MIENHKLQHDYLSQLLAPVPLASSGEISISLTEEINSNMGFIIIDRGINLKEERMFYHRKNANTVYVYSENRISPRDHAIGSQVILDSISSINYAHDNGFEQMYIYKKSASNVIVKGGQFYINGSMITISDLDTETGAYHLTTGSNNYIYIKDNNYYITTTQNNDLYSVGIVTVDVGGDISSFDMSNTLSLGGGMSPTDKTKLDAIDSSLYEKLNNKTTSIRNVTTSNDTKYPSEKAVRVELDKKIDKSATKGLSEKDFTGTYKTKLDELIGLDLPNAALVKTPVVAGTGISVDDLGDAGWKINSSSTHGLGVLGDNIDIYPITRRSNVKYLDEQRYVVLPDGSREGFTGNVKFKDGANPTISVYYNNPNEAGKILIDSHIRVVNTTGKVSECHASIPYEIDIAKGDGVFNLLPQSFVGLDYTASTVMYIKIHRVGAYVTDVHGGEFNDVINDRDTVKGNLRVRSMFIEYDATIAANKSAEYAYEHIQGGASNTWNINHSLDTNKIILQCYDDTGQPIGEDTFDIVDNNNITISFSSSVSGRAVILAAGGTLTPTTNTDKYYEQTFSNVNGGMSFNHGLNKYPSVVALDGTGKETTIEVHHTDKNNITVSWIGIQSGRIVAN